MRLFMCLGPIAALFASAVACNIEGGGMIVDELRSDGAATDALLPSSDAGPESLQDAFPTSCGDASACLGNVPAGWQIVAALKDPHASCPSAFTGVDLVHDVVLSPGACACDCADQGDAGCGGSDLACGGGDCKLFPLCGSVSPGGCGVLNNRGGYGLSASQSDLSGITCKPTQTPAAADSSPIRLCAPSCAADFCGSKGVDAQACLVANGDVDCPTYRPFQKATLGNAAIATCNPCAGCNAPNNLHCVGTMDFYDDWSCASDASFSVPLDGVCHTGPTGRTGGAIGLTLAPPPGPFCAGLAISAGGGDAVPVGPRTLCCPLF